MQKIIFLDIDGVLNPLHYIWALHQMWTSSSYEIKTCDQYGQLFFPQNCEALKRIVDETGADIVITSSWRFSGLKAMKELWIKRGLAGNVIDITPSEAEVMEQEKDRVHDIFGRTDEIAYWIKKNNFTGTYCIIDDADGVLSWQQKSFVLTNSNCGLTNKDAYMAIAILNKSR